MKKMWTLPLALLLLLALAGCSAKAKTGETLFDLDSAAWLTIFDGTTGEGVEVRDPDTVDILKDLLSRVHLKKGMSNKKLSSGFHYDFSWYNEEGEEICSIPNVNETVISYGDWFWKVVESPAGPIEETIEKVFDQELGQLVFPRGSSIIGDGFMEKKGIDYAYISTPDKEVATQNEDRVYNSIRAFSGVRVRETGPASEEDYKNYAYKVSWGKKGDDYEGIGMEIIIREDGALVYDGKVHETMSRLNGQYVVTQYLDKALEDPEGRDL